MRISVFVILLICSTESCGRQPQLPAVRVISADMHTISIEVKNDSGSDLVLLSPETPSQTVDEETCIVTLSTKIDPQIRPFAFRPKLVTIRRGSELRFHVVLYPANLSKTCKRWTILAEYAYLRPEIVVRFGGKQPEDFRQHVLQSQQLMTTTAPMSLEESM
jgi:hypothetical protein